MIYGQLVITASHTDTHPPTDLHISEDGWASITTTSNFDVYLYDHLHPDEDSEEDVTPSPLVTLSARLEEAIALSNDVTPSDTRRPFSSPVDQVSESSVRVADRDSLFQKIQSLLTHTPSDLPHPLYRRMSIVCFDPYDPSVFSGGVDSSATVTTIDSISLSAGLSNYRDRDIEYNGENEADGYVHLRSSDSQSVFSSASATYEQPTVLSRSRTDPGVYGNKHNNHRDGSLTTMDETGLPAMSSVGGSTGLRKRATASMSSKPFADSVDISTGVGETFRGDDVPYDVSSYRQEPYDDVLSYQYRGHIAMESE